MQIALGETDNPQMPSEQAAFESQQLNAILKRGTFLYIALSGLFLLLVGQNPIVLIKSVFMALNRFLYFVETSVPVWALVLVALGVGLIAPIRRQVWARKTSILAAVVYCSLFTFSFGFVKNHLHLAVPFWADDMLMQVDLALHAGNAPRGFLNWLSGWSTDTLTLFYINAWLIFATYLPVFLVAFDNNAERRRIFTLLWMACWVGLGNVIAVAFMSYGPIFADLFPGGDVSVHQDTFALVERGDAQILTAIKMHLWFAYTGESASLGSGISAFPSVHVGMATVFGLYAFCLAQETLANFGLGARINRMIMTAVILVSLSYVGAFQILSVYLGWHYAVDGYVSIVLMTAAYAALRAYGPNENAAAHPVQNAQLAGQQPLAQSAT